MGLVKPDDKTFGCTKIVYVFSIKYKNKKSHSKLDPSLLNIFYKFNQILQSII